MNAAFRDIISRYNFVILDTETTGLDRPAEICQIAIIDWDGGAYINSLIRPHRPIPAAATNVHGITNEMCLEAPRWEDVVDDIKDILAWRDVIVYNALYDRKLMHWSDEEAGLPHTEWKDIGEWYCAMLAYAEYHGEVHPHYGSYVWQTLSNAMAQQGLVIGDAHSAYADAMMTLQLVKHCTRDLPIWHTKGSLFEDGEDR